MFKVFKYEKNDTHMHYSNHYIINYAVLIWRNWNISWNSFSKKNQCCPKRFIGTMNMRLL